MRKKTFIFVIAVMGICMFTFINAGTVELAVNNGSFENYFTVGVSPSIKLFKNFYLEGELFYYPRLWENEITHIEEISYEGLYVNGTGHSKASAININISVLYQLKFKSNWKWFPYLTTGAGSLNVVEKWQWSGIDEIGYINPNHKHWENHWSFVFGGGIKYGLNDRVGVRFDARFIYTLSHEESGNFLGFFGSRFTGGFYMKLK